MHRRRPSACMHALLRLRKPNPNYAARHGARSSIVIDVLLVLLPSQSFSWTVPCHMCSPGTLPLLRCFFTRMHASEHAVSSALRVQREMHGRPGHACIHAPGSGRTGAISACYATLGAIDTYDDDAPQHSNCKRQMATSHACGGRMLAGRQDMPARHAVEDGRRDLSSCVVQ